MMRALLCLLVAAALFGDVLGIVDKSKFRTCDQTAFCRRQRSRSAEDHHLVGFAVDAGGVANGDLVHGQASDAHLKLELRFLDTGVVRARITEKTPLYGGRWEAKDLLLPEAQSASNLKSPKVLSSDDKGFPKSVDSADASALTVLSAKEGVAVAVHHSPFSLALYVDGELRATANSDNKFHFERHHPNDGASLKQAAVDTTAGKKEDKEIIDYGEDGLAIYADGSKEVREVEDDDDDVVASEGDGAWEENFGAHKDSKPYGPASIRMDIAFPSSTSIFGIPEHATSFALKDTTGPNAYYHEPFRLYNLDVFEFDLDSQMALYGGIPSLYGLTPTGDATGALWLNPTETFVDIETDENGGKKSVWISESGVVDLFFMPGPTMDDIFRQQSKLTGVTPIPPMFSLAYHQCRWNYKDEADVAQVDAHFEEENFPYDVLWLDIEHTDGKRYFTWDKKLFPHPIEMQNKIASHGRKMVTIVDPHIKRDNHFHIHKEATSKGLYIKDKDNKDFDGYCWPGQSSYLDFTAEHVRSWWADQFAYDKYVGSTEILYTWNDMNEPSVFNGPEVSMSKDAKNLEGTEHREWHNLYGYYMQQATANGLVRRNEGHNERAFVLSRAFFAGSQKFGAIWTGDNEASWEHARSSIPLLLSISLAGLPFCGSDVGGFFGNPDVELLTRWYQMGAMQPFFRAHAHHDSKRREPWVFGEPHTSHLRDAVLARYALLPYFYTLFDTHQETGRAVMLPLWYMYSQDQNTFAMEDQFLAGPDLLVKPVLNAGQTKTEVYLPGQEPWYDVDTFVGYLPNGGNTLSVETPIDKMPVFQRGGSIIPRQLRVRRSSSLMAKDPYTLFVALDSKGEAGGELYIDDGHSFDYQKDEYVRRHFSFSNGRLSAFTSTLKPAGKLAIDNTIERVVVLGLKNAPSSITFDGSNIAIDFDFHFEQNLLVLRKPDVKVVDDWSIVLH